MGTVEVSMFWIAMALILLLVVDRILRRLKPGPWHNFKCRVARVTWVPFLYHVCWLMECPFCANWVNRAHWGKTACPKCKFEVLEWRKALARCWIRDEIRGLTATQRSLWCNQNASQLSKAFELLQLDWDSGLSEIVHKGRVPGAKTNQPGAV
jgi:hypothetical protein